VRHSPSQSAYTQACTVFQLLAHRTWSDLGDGFQSGLTISEESITDFLLLDLKRALPHSIFMRKFSKAVEGRTTGADWEWWFVGQNRGFGMRVQAKRLSAGTKRYEDLGRLAGKKSGKRQIDLLLDDARKSNLYASYCFYNFWESSVPPPDWKCGSFPPDPRMFGCAIADAVAIKGLISKNANDLQSVAQHCLPWSCLVCCEGFVKKPTDSFPDRTRNLVEAFLAGQDGASTNENPVPQVIEREQWPSYITSILEAREIEEIERPENRNIDGVLVIRIE
jgi:hypothetical protein